MMLHLSNISGNSEEGKLFPQNHLVSTGQAKGVRVIGRKFIRFDQIRSDASDNPVRLGGTNYSIQNELKFSMMRGIHTSEDLPAVEKIAVPSKHTDGNVKYYVLRDGFTRLEALKELGAKGYWFDIVEFDNELSRISFSLASNNHLPSGSSKDDDIYKSVEHLVASKLLTNDFLTIKEYIMKICGLTPARAHKIADQIGNSTGAKPTVWTWKQSAIKDLSQNHELGIKSHGNYDPKRKMYGWTVLEGYEADAIANAIAKFNADKLDGLGTGQSYFVAHTKLPNSNGDLDEKRKAMKRSFDKRFSDLIALCEHYKETGKIPFELIGFLPQTSDEQALNKLVSLQSLKSKKSKDSNVVEIASYNEKKVDSSLTKALDLSTEN